MSKQTVYTSEIVVNVNRFDIFHTFCTQVYFDVYIGHEI